MKKIIFDVRASLLMCCLFLATTVSLNAQNLSLGTTNALTISGPTLVGGTYTYNAVIPYFASELTGTFTLSYGPYTCGSGYYKYITLNTGAGGFVSNSTNLNTVNIPGTIPVGFNNYVMRVYCNTAAGLPSILRATLNIRINVSREVAPAVNLNFSPYCKYVAHSNPQIYSGYIGFNVTGNYSDASKLYLRVSNGLGSCPTADYKVTWLHNTNAATATINPTASFYDCQSSTAYTIKLVYKATSVSGTPIEVVINNGDIGWNNYSWTKTFRSCLNKLEPQPQDPILVGKNANEIEAFGATKKYNVYPNPTNSDLNILPADGKEIRNAKIIDPSGLVYDSKAFRSAKGEQTISLGHLRPGIYLLEIETNEGTFIEKVVKN